MQLQGDSHSTTYSKTLDRQIQWNNSLWWKQREHGNHFGLSRLRRSDEVKVIYSNHKGETNDMVKIIYDPTLSNLEKIYGNTLLPIL